MAGKTAQEFNRRKQRKGAFWEDRYHATAIESGEHLREKLITCCGLAVDEQLCISHNQWVEAALQAGSKRRQPEWTESIAVGSAGFVEGIRQLLQPSVPGRKIRTREGFYELKAGSRGQIT